MSAARNDRAANFAEADPMVVVPGHRANESDFGESPNQRLQRLEAALPFDEIAAQQNQVRRFRGGDFDQAFEYVAGAVSSEMEVAREQETFSDANAGDVLPANHQR